MSSISARRRERAGGLSSATTDRGRVSDRDPEARFGSSYGDQRQSGGSSSRAESRYEPAAGRSAARASFAARSTAERAPAPRDDDTVDQLDELKNVLLEERSARQSMAEQLSQLVDDFKRQQNTVAGDVDGLREGVRVLAAAVEESNRAVQSDRIEAAHTKEDLSDVKNSLQQLETDVIGGLAQEVADHKDGLHMMMSLLEESASKHDLQSAAEDVANHLQASLQAGLAESQLQVAAAQELLAQDIGSVKSSTEQALESAQVGMAEMQNAMERSLESAIERATSVAAGAAKSSQATCDEMQARLDQSTQQLMDKVDNQDKRSQALASKLNVSLESHQRELISKLGTTEMELGDLVQTLDAKFESLNFTLGTRLDNEMMVMKQRVDGACEGVWSRLETHLSDIQENLRRDTAKVDTVIQQLDRKLNDSLSALAQRLGENYRMLDGQLSTVAGHADGTFNDIHKRLELVGQQPQFLPLLFMSSAAV